MGALDRLGVESSPLLPEASGRHEGEALADADGVFRRLYGARGKFLYLIRPDGYVGLFQRPVDERALRAYLAKLFGTEAVESAFAERETQVPVEARR